MGVAVNPLAKFCLVGAGGFAVVGIGLASHTNAAVSSGALQHAEEIAALVASATIQPQLDAAVFDDGLDGSEIDTLAASFERELRPLPVERVRVFGVDGQIVYSDDRELIGTRPPPSDQFRAAIDGDVVSALEDAASPNAADTAAPQLLEVYVPVRYDDGAIAGVFELFLPYESTAQRIRRQALRRG